MFRSSFFAMTMAATVGRVLASKATPQHLTVETRVEPPIAASASTRSRRHTRLHHHRVAVSKLLQNRIVLKVEQLLAIQLRFGRRRRIAVIDLRLLLFLRQHRLRVLDPAIMKYPSAGWNEPFFRAALKIRSEEHTSELQSPYDLVCR